MQLVPVDSILLSIVVPSKLMLTSHPSFPRPV